MTTEQIKDVQRRIGFTGDDVDGFWGTKSIHRCKVYLNSLMPVPNPWPESYREIEEFYGKRESVRNHFVRIDVTSLGILYDKKPVNSILVHSKCAESLLRILTKISKSEFAYILKYYGGCFMSRKMVNGDKWSTHSWAIAVDIDSTRNRNMWHWPIKASMPIEVMEFFAEEGWTPAGAFWGRDGMHFQACG